MVLLKITLPKLQRSNILMPFEKFHKIGRIIEPECVCYLPDVHIGMQDVPLCFQKQLICNMISCTLTCKFPTCCIQVLRGGIEQFSKLINSMELWYI